MIDVKKILKERDELPLLDYGRIPPQATDLEEAILGACLIEKIAIDTAAGIVRPEMFYKEAHSIIFEACTNLYMKGHPVDQLTVTNRLRETEQLEIVGGPFYITQLTNKIASAANIEFHCRIVVQQFIKREMIRISSEIIKDAYEESSDCFELLEKAQQEIFDIDRVTTKNDFQLIHEIIYDTTKEIEKRAASKTGFTGIGSGFTELDRITNGWQQTDLVILAGRPGSGKTAMVLNAARNAAATLDKKVAVFSVEMAKTQLAMRLLSTETEIEHEKLRRGQLTQTDWQVYNQKITDLVNANLYIDDTPSLQLMDFVSKARRMKSKHDIDMILVDYIQLMKVPGMKVREQEISMISSTIKATAKDLEIPIIALAQLSREVEKRAGKRPQLSDLRESGAIEQDADLVMFIYRPEYYGFHEWDDGTPSDGQAEIIIAKHRNGSIGNVRLQFNSSLVKFADLDADIEMKQDNRYEFI